MDIFDEIKEILYVMDAKWVADNAGVSVGCIYARLDGTTQLPRLDTISKVAECLGFDIRLVKVALLKQVA